MLAKSFLTCGQGLGLAAPALQQGLQHLLSLHSNSYSSSAAVAFASKAKAQPPYLLKAPKGASKKKDASDKPPRAVSAYAWYVKEHAKARAGKGEKVSQVMKELGAEWKAMPDYQKQTYLDLAEQSKAEAAKAREARNDARRDARGPPSAYNQWCKEVLADMRASNLHFKGPDFIREAAARWRELPEGEKERRKAEAQAAKAAWQAAQPEQ